jgi:hypothetical protein
VIVGGPQTYTWREGGVDYFLETLVGEGERLLSWRCWASLEPRMGR